MRPWLLLLFGGCVADGTKPPDLVVENMAVLDVIIAPSGVTIFAEAELHGEYCATHFPGIGEQIHVSDALFPCEPSLFGCVERITYAGSIYETPTTSEPLRIASPPSGQTLVLEGCGVRSVVALPIVSLPAPPTMVHGAVMHDAQNRVIDVAWDNDPRAATHLVTLGTTIWSEVHHVASDTETFTTPFLGSLFTSVQSLLPGSQQITEHGLVRLWPGSDATGTAVQATAQVP